MSLAAGFGVLTLSVDAVHEVAYVGYENGRVSIFQAPRLELPGERLRELRGWAAFTKRGGTRRIVPVNPGDGHAIVVGSTYGTCVLFGFGFGFGFEGCC